MREKRRSTRKTNIPEDKESILRVSKGTGRSTNTDQDQESIKREKRRSTRSTRRENIVIDHRADDDFDSYNYINQLILFKNI